MVSSARCPAVSSSFFFFNDTATTEIYTLSLHDALPICSASRQPATRRQSWRPSGRSSWPGSPRSTASWPRCAPDDPQARRGTRSEEHTSELQSPDHLVCRLLLEKKKKP